MNLKEHIGDFIQVRPQTSRIPGPSERLEADLRAHRSYARLLWICVRRPRGRFCLNLLDALLFCAFNNRREVELELRFIILSVRVVQIKIGLRGVNAAVTSD